MDTKDLLSRRLSFNGVLMYLDESKGSIEKGSLAVKLPLNTKRFLTIPFEVLSIMGGYIAKGISDINVIYPFLINKKIFHCRTARKAVNKMLESNTKLLTKINIRNNGVYYGNRYCILDSNFNILLLLVVDIEKEDRAYKIKSIRYLIDKSVFTNNTNIMSKFIINNIMPILLEISNIRVYNLPQGLETFNSVIYKVDIEDLSKYKGPVNAPIFSKNSNSSEENLVKRIKYMLPLSVLNMNKYIC